MVVRELSDFDEKTVQRVNGDKYARNAKKAPGKYNNYVEEKLKIQIQTM
jgi:hypothetical protein